VVKPTIEDAAADQVDSRLAEITPTDPGDPDSGDATGDTVPTTAAPSGESPVSDGVPTFLRFEVAAPLTQTADESTTLPDGGTFDLTDMRIENTFNDRGVATLLVNSEPMFIWSLDNVRGSYFEPRITPIRLDSGDNITFSVRCDEIGDTGRSSCTTALNVVGLVNDADS
jgi:hypothetical protein